MPALADSDSVEPVVENLAQEMGRATKRLRSKAWMINAMGSGATVSQPAEPAEAETAATD